MLKNLPISPDHLLVSTLALADVQVEVSFPMIVISMLMPCFGIREYEDVRSLSRGIDAALATSPILLVKMHAKNRVSAL